MDLNRIKALAGIQPAKLKKTKNLYESAPPGMEDVVMKLKSEYPNNTSKAFATAWSIYNKNNAKSKLNEFRLGNGSDDVDGFATGPGGELTFGGHLTLDDLENANSMDSTSEHSSTIDAICQDLCDLGYSEDEVSEIINAVSSELESGDCGDGTGEDCDITVSVDEADDFNSGYDDLETLDCTDYFPSGADGSITGYKGPSGARHGDNPEHDSMSLYEGDADTEYRVSDRELEVFVRHLSLRGSELGDRLRDAAFRKAVTFAYEKEFGLKGHASATGKYNKVKHYLMAKNDPRVYKLGREEGKNNGGRKPGGDLGGGIPGGDDVDARLAALELQKQRIQRQADELAAQRQKSMQGKEAAARAAQQSANDLFGNGVNNQPELFETYKELVYSYRKHLEESEVLDPIKVNSPVLGADEKMADKPGGWTVMLFNDDYTPHEVVIEALMGGAGMSEAQARTVTGKAHRDGWYPVRSYASIDIAEAVADRISKHAHFNTNYDHYRSHPHFKGFRGPWRLATDVVEAN